MTAPKTVRTVMPDDWAIMREIEFDGDQEVRDIADATHLVEVTHAGDCYTAFGSTLAECKSVVKGYWLAGFKRRKPVVKSRKRRR